MVRPNPTNPPGPRNPLRNKRLVAGHIKENQWLISPSFRGTLDWGVGFSPEVQQFDSSCFVAGFFRWLGPSPKLNSSSPLKKMVGKEGPRRSKPFLLGHFGHFSGGCSSTSGGFFRALGVLNRTRSESPKPNSKNAPEK